MITQGDVKTFEERNTKTLGTKVEANRAEREAMHDLESLVTHEHHFKHLRS